MRELESYVGTPLFERTCSGVSLNQAGNVFHGRVLSYINGLQNLSLKSERSLERIIEILIRIFITGWLYGPS
ncbi:hypothetical protein [Escherichia coli]|uniref:hypothetical protein n=1 Tax=Escherichia coli TaxID=562 RepID=UPI002074BA66|nr:hypothetical protein [Escherichia coli]